MDTKKIRPTRGTETLKQVGVNLDLLSLGQNSLPQEDKDQILLRMWRIGGESPGKPGTKCQVREFQGEKAMSSLEVFSEFGSKILTESQISKFVREHSDELKRHPYGTIFFSTVGGESPKSDLSNVLIALIFVGDGGERKGFISSLLDDPIWPSTIPHGVVI